MNPLLIGAAGVHVSCADLLKQDFRAFMTGEGFPYDLGVENRREVIRIQAKATCHPWSASTRESYCWRLTGTGNRSYDVGEFDLFALVALDINRVAYILPSECGQTVTIRSNADTTAPARGGRTGRSFDELTFSAALERLGIHRG